jgi:hypothetical protein
MLGIIMSASKKVRRLQHSKKALLREFYMLLTADEREAFLNAVGTSQAYLMQIYGGFSLGSEALVEAIQDASHGVIPAWYLRPDLYQRESLI